MSSPLPDASGLVVRRAPFSDNPRVGARGQRTQQRILDAALHAFGEEGYHRCSVGRITKLARCSRVSFYQYFASKEDVFHHLAGQVARQVSASTEALNLMTPDHDGWRAMRAWIGRYAEIHARYEPVFHAYETDDALATFAARTGADVITRVRSRLATTTLPPRQLDPVIRLLLQCVNHALGVAGVLRSVAPSAYPRERIEAAITDVMHRTFFGVHAAVNVHAPAGPAPPALPFSPEIREMLQDSGTSVLSEERTVNGTLGALLASGRDVFVRLGYHNTRVDDIVAEAGLSHGAFYRYFRSKGELARILTVGAYRSTGAVLMEIPDLFDGGLTGSKAALRRWLRRYHAAHAHEAAMLRVWIDGVLQDPALRADYAPPLDWGRRRLARYLEPRDFGDVDIEAVVMVALLGVFGAQSRPPADIEAAAHIIERGLLGL
jgi:AcrR family transcriptional regulator